MAEPSVVFGEFLTHGKASATQDMRTLKCVFMNVKCLFMNLNVYL